MTADLNGDFAYDESGGIVAHVPSKEEVQCEAVGEWMNHHVNLFPQQRQFITKDSGKRMVEATGAQRDTNDGKGRFDLIAPVPLRRLAELYQRGAQKYGDRNWEKGINLSRYIDSALRHINDYQTGDRSEDHLISAAWNLFAFVATEDKINKGLLPPELDNMPVREDQP